MTGNKLLIWLQNQDANVMNVPIFVGIGDEVNYLNDYHANTYGIYLFGDPEGE